MAAERLSLSGSFASRPQGIIRALMSVFSRLVARLNRPTAPVDPCADPFDAPPVPPSRADLAPSATFSGLERALAVVAEALPNSDDRWRRQFVGAVLAMGEREVRSDFERRIRAAHRAGDHAAIARRAVARLDALKAQAARAHQSNAIGAAAAYLQQRTGLDDSTCQSIAFGAIARFLKTDSESASPLRPANHAFQSASARRQEVRS